MGSIPTRSSNIARSSNGRTKDPDSFNVGSIPARASKMKGNNMKDFLTVDGRPVTIETENKSGMSIFCVFGTLDGFPCHWTKDGKYRMNGKDDPRDIVNFADVAQR